MADVEATTSKSQQGRLCMLNFKMVKNFQQYNSKIELIEDHFERPKVNPWPFGWRSVQLPTSLFQAPGVPSFIKSADRSWANLQAQLLVVSPWWSWNRQFQTRSPSGMRWLWVVTQRHSRHFWGNVPWLNQQKKDCFPQVLTFTRFFRSEYVRFIRECMETYGNHWLHPPRRNSTTVFQCSLDVFKLKSWSFFDTSPKSSVSCATPLTCDVYVSSARSERTAADHWQER